MKRLDQRRLIWGLGLFAGLSFLGGVLLAVLDPTESGVRSYEADTFSRSAVGHRGFARWLRAIGVPVVISRAGTATKAGPGTVLAILEPPVDVDPDRLRRLIDESEAAAVILALPKWTVTEHAVEGGFIAEVEPVAHDDRDKVLHALYVTAQSASAAEGEWVLGETPTDVELTAPHGVRGELVPRLSRGDTVVVGQERLYGRPLLLIADPDLISNAGLVAHAPLLAEILRPHLQGRVLVIDETLHGHQSVASLARQLFEFPLAAVTVQAIAMALLAILAGVRRFGAPVALARGVGRGRRVLIENTAALTHHAGHDDDALRRYWETTLRRVRARLNAPAELDGPALTTWLGRVGHSRGVEGDPAALAEAVDAARPADHLATARRIDAWRRALLGTPLDTPLARPQTPSKPTGRAAARRS